MSSAGVAPPSATCTGSPSLNLDVDPTIGYQYPNNNQVSGYVCETSPFGIYSAQRLANCCMGPLHTVSQPTSPGDISYPASCVSWCYVNATLDIIGNTTPENPYGFSEFYLCLYPDAYSPNGPNSTGFVTCGFVNDPAGEASMATVLPSPATSITTQSVQTNAHTADPPGSAQTSTEETETLGSTSAAPTTSARRTSSATSTSPSSTTSAPAAAAPTTANTGTASGLAGVRKTILVTALWIVSTCFFIMQ
ncbi:hypothetical protein ANO11243_005150 [Dothideomycetidae sp. 11243]|nr:hypothetical protein ANO11243_005150 [fungal sp. No.11243]